MSPNIEYHKKSSIIFICLLILINSINLYSQSYNYSGSLSYLDGTPIVMSQNDIDHFDIELVSAPDILAGHIRDIKNGTITLLCGVTGNYTLKFMGIEIARFEVLELNDKYISNLPDQLSLPFNYLAITNPNKTVKVYDENVNLIESFQANENGHVPLTGDENYFSDKFLVIEPKNQFPQISLFKEIKTKDKGKFNYRKLSFPSPQLHAKAGLVHNISDDNYYSIMKVSFPDKNKGIWLFKKYDVANKKSTIRKLNLPANLRSNDVKLYLDEIGKLVLVSHNQNYSLDKNGNLGVRNDAYVYPYYRFKGNYVQGTQWIIPTFMGIALTEGAHNFILTCDGSWSEPNPAYWDWKKRLDEITDETYHGKNNTAEKIHALQQEYASLVKNEPTPMSFDKNGTRTSNVSFQVIFSPEESSLWKFDGSQNFEENYIPSVYDPESEISEIQTLEKCVLSVDGSGNMDYSYKDSYECKGIMYMDFDTDEQRKEATESCMSRATVNMGFEGETATWGSGLPIFDNTWDLTGKEPINSWEGPYPELRYGFRELLGSYDNIKEAREHCKTPQYDNRIKKYNCYEGKVVRVCLDNYSFSVADNRVITNYNSLYCGETEPEESIEKGDEIVVVFSKEGYITETRALLKRTMETGNVLLSGHVTDEQGVELEGATIKLRNIDGAAETDDAGIYNLTAKAQGEKSHSEVIDIKLKKIGLEISHEELGEYKNEPWGIVADGFTTLILKVKTKGIRPNTVSVKQPELGQFVEHTMLKVPLVLNEDGEGEMEYIPPEYLTSEQLNVQLPLVDTTHARYGMGHNLWVAEVPIDITYENEEGNLGSMQIKIYVTRPPVFPIHGFTGNEDTWKDLGIYLRARKFTTIIREYYKGPADESTIQRQSQKLGQYIQDIRDCYKNNGIYLTRIDITAHSMGGLISRHYISNMARYGERSGIVIPYNVKLSQAELSSQRFQTPVILNDIRKLIMVGTPNHGATWIDGRIGHFSALFGGVHQVANSQLRSNSQFLANLNEGENQGRHLAPNVQYALLYGRRRLKSLWPPDKMKFQFTNPVGLYAGHVTEDDGVVKVSSAKLNGVVDFPFPEKIDNPYGFIHSPALSFPYVGDKSITTDTEIFNKVNELLLEDIPRMSLKNSFTKVYGTEGDVNIRYYSTEAWQPMASGTSKKLENHWCQFKTGEGRTSIAFFQNNFHWGSIHIEPQTILRIENASPELVEVYLQQGKARFTSRKKQGGGFEIAMGEETEKWYNFNPQALVIDINTDFILEKDESIKVRSIDGNVSVGFSDEKPENMQGKKIKANEGIEFTQFDEMIDSPLPDSGWWSNIDTTYLPDESFDNKLDKIIDNNLIDSANKSERHDNITPLQNTNKNPVVDFEIGTVSGGPFEAPVWVKFYPSGTYDPDGYIILFEIDMNGDGLYDVVEKTLTGSSYEFTSLGEYTASVRVTDEKGGTTTISKSFTISGPYTDHITTMPVQREEKKYEEPEIAVVLEPKDDVNKKLDSIIEEYNYEEDSSKKYVEQKKPESKESEISELISTPLIIGTENLIKNGSFEKPIVSAAFQSINKGGDIGGWTVSKGEIDLVGVYFNNSDGNQSIDLHGSPGFGAIEQKIATKPSSQYEISFDLAGNAGGPPTLKKVQVTAAGDSEEFEFDCTGKTNQRMGWITKKWIFTAIDNYTTISFSTLHNSGNAGAGPAIDNIKVYELVTQEVVDKIKPKEKKRKDKKKSKKEEKSSEKQRIELVADASVYEYSYQNWKDANFGKYTILRVGSHATGGEKWVYVRFDISDIDKLMFDQATLKLYCSDIIGSKASNFNIYQIVENWQEGDGTYHEGQVEAIDSLGAITWSNKPEFISEQYEKIKLKKESGKWVIIDVTEFVNNWLNGEPNYGLVIKPVGDLLERGPTSIYEFCSREFQDASKIPYVEIQFK